MTDDDLTPEQQEVRRLLADARHEQPVPESVVARLDRVLAGLADEPVRDAPVTALATRRRRAGSLLLAAAAVVAIGVGVGQVVDTGSDDADDMAASERDDADAGADEESAPEASAPGQERKDSDGNDSTSSDQPEETSAEEFAELDRSNLAKDVVVVRRQNGSVEVGGLAAAYAAAGATCRARAWGEGQFVPVRYDGIPAVLVFRRATGDTQVADVYVCGDAEPRRSVTLPAP